VVDFRLYLGTLIVVPEKNGGKEMVTGQGCGLGIGGCNRWCPAATGHRLVALFPCPRRLRTVHCIDPGQVTDLLSQALLVLLSANKKPQAIKPIIILESRKIYFQPGKSCEYIMYSGFILPLLQVHLE
jgi:hypothetical protein